jgi:hypothetical protein
LGRDGTGRWQLTFTQVNRSREFKPQVQPPNAFGSLTLSVAFQSRLVLATVVQADV